MGVRDNEQIITSITFFLSHSFFKAFKASLVRKFTVFFERQML